MRTDKTQGSICSIFSIYIVERVRQSWLGQGGPSFKRVINYLCGGRGEGVSSRTGRGAACVSEVHSGPGKVVWKRSGQGRAQPEPGRGRRVKCMCQVCAGGRGRGKGCLGRNLICGGPGLFCTHCISLTPLNYAVNNIHGGVDCTKITHLEHS